jgi:hypothetical protein
MKVELSTPVKLAMLVLLAVLIGFIAVHQGPDARRYIKMETM